MTAHSASHPTVVRLILLVVLLSLPLSGLAQDWTFAGPYTGAVHQFWPSPHDPDLVFVRGQLDGSDPNERLTMVSHDGGVSFTTSYPLEILTELVFDENDPATLYAISEDEFFISTNTGETWDGYDLFDHGGPDYGRFLTKQPGDDGALFLMAGDDDHDRGFGLYKSEDHGLTWTVEYGAGNWLMNHFYEMCFDPNNANRLFGLKHAIHDEPDSRLLMRFNFQEGFWESVYDPVLYDVYDLRFNPVFPGTMYLEFGAENGFSQTLMNDDLDYPWELIPGPWDEDAEYHASFLADGTLTVITRDGQYAQNYPGPDWWQVQSFDTSPLEFTELFTSHFTVHPADLDRIYARREHVFLRSLDAGATWSVNTEGFSCPDAVSVEVNKSDPQTLLANAYRFLYLSNDGGVSWRLIDSAIDIHGLLQPKDPDFIVSWSMYRDLNLYTPLRYSNDGGETWQNCPDVPGYLVDVALHPDTTGSAYVVGSDGMELTVFHGHDLFTDWQETDYLDEQPVRVVPDPIHDDHVFAHADTELYKSTDGGATFDQIGNPFIYPYTSISLQPDGEAMTMFSIDSYSGHYSPDRNGTWGDEISLPWAMYDLQVTWNGDLLAIAHTFRLFLSEDQGDTWTELYDADQDIVNAAVHANRTIYLGTMYNGVWMLPNGLSVDESDSFSTIPAEFSLEPAYPNPFNAMTSFAFNLPQPGAVDVQVYDVLGRLVAMLANQKHYPAGRHLLVWDASAAASGVYLIRASDRMGSTRAIRVTLVK